MLEDYFEPFLFMTKVKVPDDFDVFRDEYVDGASFRAGITTNNSNEAQIAQQSGLKTIYTIVHPITMELSQNDRVKRVKDGRVYRITSNSADMTTPAVAQVKFSQVTAEVVTP